MPDTFLPFSPPLIGEEEIAEVVDTLRSDWITTGPKVRRFEEEFAAFIGAPAALALNSCTAALHVALTTLGIGPGDAVITTPMTFCSSVHVIEHVGARPILVDVEADTLNIDPRQIEQAIEQRSRGAGGAGESESDLARSSLRTPVRDGHHSRNRPTPRSGHHRRRRPRPPRQIQGPPHRFSGSPQHPSSLAPLLTAFSFYATKNLTTAEGGMLTGSPDFIEEARIWSLHGMSRDAWKRYSAEGSWYYEVVRPGFKYNMTDIQAAIGLHQLRKLPQFQARRREIVRRYSEAFSQFEELQIPTERPEVEHAWHLYVLRLNPEMLPGLHPSPGRGGDGGGVRNQFIEELKLRNIGTSVHFIPIHLHPYYLPGQVRLQARRLPRGLPGVPAHRLPAAVSPDERSGCGGCDRGGGGRGQEV